MPQGRHDPPLGDLHSDLDFSLGKSRALQIVVMMAQKFSLSRTLSIRCGARPSKSLLCGTTGAEAVYRIWTQEVGCAPCRSNGPICQPLLIESMPFCCGQFSPALPDLFFISVCLP